MPKEIAREGLNLMLQDFYFQAGLTSVPGAPLALLQQPDTRVCLVLTLVHLPGGGGGGRGQRNSGRGEYHPTQKRSLAVQPSAQNPDNPVLGPTTSSSSARI